MSVRRAVFGAFGRSSSAISFVVIVAFTVMILSTAYYMLAFTPQEFVQLPVVQQYENIVENVMGMEEPARTQYYWYNNLIVAGYCAFGTPSYFGFNTTVATSKNIGMSITSNYYDYRSVYGLGGLLAFPAMLFIHGLFELTGIFIIAAVSFRAAWNLWKGLGGLSVITAKEGRTWSWKPTKREKREILKHKHEIKLLVSDFIILFVIGLFFIFLGALIESYISPNIGYIFLLEPAAAAVFLAAIGLFYALIVARGFNRMRGDLKFIWNETKLISKGKFRPTQLSLLTFVGFFVWALIQQHII